jgi:hypothetical protein
MADPDKRVLGAMIGGLTSAVMFIIAAVGVIEACLVPRAN